MRLRWFSFLIWAIGGSNLTLRSRDSTSVYAPNDSRVKTALQGIYDLARLETAAISSSLKLTEDHPERFLEAAERSPQGELSVFEMTHIHQLYQPSTHIAPIDLLHAWSQNEKAMTKFSTSAIEGAQRYRSQYNIIGVSRLGRSMVWIFSHFHRNTSSIEVYSTVELEGTRWKVFISSVKYLLGSEMFSCTHGHAG